MKRHHASLLRNGFTLIEAVAALAICATALAGLLAARHRLLRQAQRSSQIARADGLAGELIGDWRADQLAVGPGERTSGEDQLSGLVWRARCEQQQLSEGVFMVSLRVRVYDGGVKSSVDPLVSLEAWEPIGSR